MHPVTLRFDDKDLEREFADEYHARTLVPGSFGLTQLAPVASVTTRALTTVEAMARPVALTAQYVRCVTNG